MKENSGTKQYELFSLVNVRETVHDRICLKLIRRQDFIPYKTSKGAVHDNIIRSISIFSIHIIDISFWKLLNLIFKCYKKFVRRKIHRHFELKPFPSLIRLQRAVNDFIYIIWWKPYEFQNNDRFFKPYCFLVIKKNISSIILFPAYITK